MRETILTPLADVCNHRFLIPPVPDDLIVPVSNPKKQFEHLGKVDSCISVKQEKDRLSRLAKGGVVADALLKQQKKQDDDNIDIINSWIPRAKKRGAEVGEERAGVAIAGEPINKRGKADIRPAPPKRIS